MIQVHSSNFVAPAWFRGKN